jgi:hypothetical protein
MPKQKNNFALGYPINFIVNFKKIFLIIFYLWDYTGIIVFAQVDDASLKRRPTYLIVET